VSSSATTPAVRGLTMFHSLEKARRVPLLDPGFAPAVLTDRTFHQKVVDSGEAVPLLFALERVDGSVSRHTSLLFPDGHHQAGDNLPYAERTLKFLLWQLGGWRVYVAAPERVVRYLQASYGPDGPRAFDAQFMGEQVYQLPFTLVPASPSDVPEVCEDRQTLGRHLNGCRIGFDLGASDLKVSAVIDGRAVFSQEIEWHPRDQADPLYHRDHIRSALHLAASHLPRLDAIGGSSAGVYLKNRPMVASLFRGIAPERYHEVRNLFDDLQGEMGVPLAIVNDGEVAALAGSMSLEVNAVMGLAMGSSQAAGYVTADGTITDWLNELAFAPVDYSPEAPIDEWSGDRGCGASYFSQQAVFRLAATAGLSIPSELTPARKLEFVQARLEAGEQAAVRIWKTMGTYLGYGIAHYADFYDMRHVLLLGRCTSGAGGPLLIEEARAVLADEFPSLAAGVRLHLPDEKSRRVGQAIAAASLPEVPQTA
jgi:predicted NBD/HSP70 family sugar kinase